ncbi:UNVERIFIED_ORG: hypothetical protein EDC92_11939 [Dietzia maris]|uniref:hypothetical protein n=1 Tax=Dietzia maris TaxID=37915 RepID=UPI001042B444
MTSASLLARPEQVLSWADSLSKRLERALLTILAVTVVGYCTYVSTGPSGLAVVVGLLAVAALAVIGTRRAPQVTGTIASTVGFSSAVAIVSTSLDPLWALVGVDDYVVLYPMVLAAVAAMSWIIPSAGVHRGWTTLVGQCAVMATLPVAVWAGPTGWRGFVILAGAFAGLLTVGLRVRKVPPGERGRGWAKVARGGAMAGVVGLLGMSLAVGSAGTASASPWGWVWDNTAGGAISGQVCDFTRPDLTSEPLGTGPEALFSNVNFAKATRLVPNETDRNGYPQYADVAAVFEPGPDNALSPKYTLYELAGLRGLKWVNWQKDQEGEERCAVNPWISSLVGNLMLKGSNYVLQATIAFKEYSQVTNPLVPLYDQANPIVDRLFNQFFIPMAGVMFTLVAISLAMKALRSNGLREALSDVGGSLMVFFIAGVAYGSLVGASFSNPGSSGFYTIGSVLDKFGAGINNGISEVVFSTVEVEQGSMCVRPESNGDGLAPGAPGQRITSCLLAESLAYKPWAMGQFGAAGATALPASAASAGSDPRPDAAPTITGTEGELPCYNAYNGCQDMRSYLIAQMGGPDISSRVGHCLDASGGSDDEASIEALAKCEPYHAVADQLYLQMGEDGETSAESRTAVQAMSAYRSQGSLPHVSQAFAAGIGTIVVGIGLSAMALITLGWHAWLFVLFLFGLVRLLWAAYPGKAKLATSWVSDVMSTFTQRIIYGIAMTLMIWVISIVFAMPINTGLKVLWSVATLVGAWMMIKKIQTFASADSPNIGKYGGIATAAVPSAAAYYGGKKALEGTGYVGRKTVGAARVTGRAGRAATINAGKSVGGAAASATRAGADVVSEKATNSRPAHAIRAKGMDLVNRADSGDDKAARKVARFNKVYDSVDTAGAAVKRTGYHAGSAARGVRKAASSTRESMSQSTWEQLRGSRPGMLDRDNLDQSGESARDREMDRRAAERKRKDVNKAYRASERDRRAQMGPGAPVNSGGRKKPPPPPPKPSK